MLDFFEVIGLIVLGSMVATVLFILLVYIKSWLSIREYDDDKRHWRE